MRRPPLLLLPLVRSATAQTGVTGSCDICPDSAPAPDTTAGYWCYDLASYERMGDTNGINDATSIAARNQW